ncbi:hypothetical protein PEC302107_09320 [Pectobacterium araliae]|uniref:Glycosyltransferase n=1 Tax=Pectobacterium araliae TaxID=3073862 RepID=A0AAN0KHW9_9GAMM|nr:hypothetical protein PEC302110_00890 [Pectobacterium sp. MAFF 302110]GKW19203.1 hypothetical protein PEC302107_09320 [Pectobacterium carotovorum subsp. carotovorum]
MKITSVVIIYNAKLNESDTLKSILECHLESVELNICIWNNGPTLLDEKDISHFLLVCQEKKVSVEIYQDIRNLALSKIYNFFIKKNNFDLISILDQDSILPKEFLSNLSHYDDADILIPKIVTEIESNPIQIYPHEDGSKKIISEGKVKNKINSAMSGVTISQKFIKKIIKFRGAPFEERLAFYGIDSDLFREIGLMIDKGISINMYCKSQIIHSFSNFDPKEKNNKFRDMEIFYFKYFIRLKYQKKSVFSTLLILIKDLIRFKNSFLKTKNLVEFTLTGTHPRSKIDILDNFKSTHTQYRINS